MSKVQAYLATSNYRPGTQNGDRTNGGSSKILGRQQMSRKVYESRTLWTWTRMYAIRLRGRLVSVRRLQRVICQCLPGPR